MAKLLLTAKYKNTFGQLPLIACIVSAPLWAGIFPMQAICFLFILVTGTVGRGSAVLCFWEALTDLALFAIGALLTLLFADNRIIASESGLRVPVFAAASTFFRNHLPWQKITSMQIIGDQDRGIEHLDLRIIVADIGTIKIWLGGLSGEDLEKILQSAEVWLPAPAKTPFLQSVEEKLSAIPLLSGGRSQKSAYTAELDHRFTSTAFVPLEPGELLESGNLKVVRQLSFGGLSAVYLTQEKNQKLYVLKESVVPESTREEIKAKAVELFRREAFILSRLDHPHIVKVLRSFAEKDREYLLLEYLPGVNLRQLVREQGPLVEADVASLALALSGILSYLHGFRPAVLHRDVTPENIILGDDQLPLLIDFGVANEFLGTATGTLVGKHCYISPEQFRGKATTGSDLYALGCTMHFLLTGEDPIPLSQSRPGEMRDISPAMNDLVAALTEQDQTNRIATAEELADRLQYFLPKT